MAIKKPLCKHVPTYALTHAHTHTHTVRSLFAFCCLFSGANIWLVSPHTNFSLGFDLTPPYTYKVSTYDPFCVLPPSPHCTMSFPLPSWCYEHLLISIIACASRFVCCLCRFSFCFRCLLSTPPHALRAANAHCAQMRISLTLLIFSLLSVLHACQLPRPLFTTVVSGAVITWLWRLLTCLLSLSLSLCECVCVCVVFLSVCEFVFFCFLGLFFLLLLYVLHFSWLNNCSFHLQLPFVCTLSHSLSLALSLCLLLLLLLFLLLALLLWLLLLLLTMLWGHLNKFYCCRPLSASDSDRSCPRCGKSTYKQIDNYFARWHGPNDKRAAKNFSCHLLAQLKATKFYGCDFDLAPSRCRSYVPHIHTHTHRVHRLMKLWGKFDQDVLPPFWVMNDQLSLSVWVSECLSVLILDSRNHN